MLTLYTSPDILETTNKHILCHADDDFDSWFVEQQNGVVDDTVKHLMKAIDGSEYTSGYTMKTREGRTLDMTYLSTGCKTAINVYTRTDCIVLAQECGDNALIEILQLHQGNVIMLRKPWVDIDGFDTDCELIVDEEHYICKDFDDCDRYWRGGWL